MPRAHEINPPSLARLRAQKRSLENMQKEQMTTFSQFPGCYLAPYVNQFEPVRDFFTGEAQKPKPQKPYPIRAVPVPQNLTGG